VLSGRYRVRVPLRGVDATASEGIMTIPAGATLSIVGHPDGDRFVTVGWGVRLLLVFSQDLLDRTTPYDPSQSIDC
jgi:hypothetical protein